MSDELVKCEISWVCMHRGVGCISTRDLLPVFLKVRRTELLHEFGVCQINEPVTFHGNPVLDTTILKAGKDFVDLFLFCNVFVFKIAKTCHFESTHDCGGDITRSKERGSASGVFESHKLRLISHFGLNGRTADRRRGRLGWAGSGGWGRRWGGSDGTWSGRWATGFSKGSYSYGDGSAPAS